MFFIPAQTATVASFPLSPFKALENPVKTAYAFVFKLKCRFAKNRGASNELLRMGQVFIPCRLNHRLHFGADSVVCRHDLTRRPYYV
jgi:hypothetical protein